MSGRQNARRTRTSRRVASPPPRWGASIRPAPPWWPRPRPRDAVVPLDPLDPSVVPATLPDGAIRVAPGFAVSMEGVPLQKAAELDLTLSGDVAPPGTNLTLYVAAQDSV